MCQQLKPYSNLETCPYRSCSILKFCILFVWLHQLDFNNKIQDLKLFFKYIKLMKSSRVGFVYEATVLSLNINKFSNVLCIDKNNFLSFIQRFQPLDLSSWVSPPVPVTEQSLAHILVDNLSHLGHRSCSLHHLLLLLRLYLWGLLKIYIGVSPNNEMANNNYL